MIDELDGTEVLRSTDVGGQHNCVSSFVTRCFISGGVPVSFGWSLEVGVWSAVCHRPFASRTGTTSRISYIAYTLEYYSYKVLYDICRNPPSNM